MTELVHLETDRGIATITLDSPDNRNALSDGLLEALEAHLATALADGDVRGIVLTGTGTVFCSGADLRRDRSRPDNSMPVLSGIVQALWTSPKPVVTVVNGHVRAGGTGLVAAADIAVAADDATFAFTEVRLGLVPAVIGAVCTRRMTSRSVGRYFLTGETFDAAAAVDAGLLSAAVPRGDLPAATDELTAAIRQTEPGAVAITKQLIADVVGWTLAEGLERAAAISADRFASPEAAEGMAAFREKRPPRWAE